MIPRAQYFDNLALAEGVRGVPGSIVECGVWRGGMIGGIAATLGEDRTYVLADSFEGLPPAEDVDGAALRAWQADTTAPGYHNNVTAAEHEARSAMSLAGISDPVILKGWFADTVPKFAADAAPIALLRLDGDLYESTMTCLTHLFPLVIPGGMVIIDDYGVWDGCTKAVHRYLADEGRSEPLRRTPVAGVTYLRRS